MTGIALAGAGAVLSGYLSIASFSEAPVAGCGAGGCSAVLSSTWAKIAGVPVAALALVLYLVVATLLVRPWRLIGRWRAVLAVAAGLLLAAAAWFILIQATMIDGWCPWCLTTHGVGAALAVVLLAMATQRRSFALLGVPAVLALALLQVIWPTDAMAPIVRPSAEVVPTRAPADEPVSAAPTVEEQPVAVVSLLDGDLTFDAAELPRTGVADARHLGAVLFDYTCPHCRHHHETLDTFEQSQPGALALAMMPVPLNSRCNREWYEFDDHERFAAACDLATLSLVIWKAAPQTWPAFDNWLWEGDDPPTAPDAYEKAMALLGEQSLRDAEAVWAEWAQQQIDRNIDAWLASGKQALPTTLVPGHEPIVGVVRDPEVFAEVVGVLDARDGR